MGINTKYVPADPDNRLYIFLKDAGNLHLVTKIAQVTPYGRFHG